MSEQTTEEVTEETEAPEAEAEEREDDTEQESDEDERDESWNPERARRTIAKIASEKKALRERATKAEEKANSVDEVTRERDDLSAANLRLEVGYELGLPLSLAKRLQGSTRDELVADAKELVDTVSPSGKPNTRKPQEALRGGLEPDKEPEETDLSKLGERIFRS